MRMLTIVLGLTLTACRTPIPTPPPLTLSPEALAQRQEQLAAAVEAHERNPNDADAIIVLGRRTAALRRYREAIAIFTEGARKHPLDARMLRQRGQRWIVLRQFDRAIDDFSRAAKLMQGLPDQAEPDATIVSGLPSTTLQSNVWYYLGLSHRLRGETREALRAYRECRKASKSADDVVSSSYWLYLTLLDAGRAEEADQVLANAVRRDDELVDNDKLYQKLLHVFRGELAAEELLREPASTVPGATFHYGIAQHFIHTGHPELARPLLEKILEGGSWTSFAYMAAEAELRRR
jgi:tetratricopeptide (TPR) repeat protein